MTVGRVCGDGGDAALQTFHGRLEAVGVILWLEEANSEQTSDENVHFRLHLSLPSLTRPSHLAEDITVMMLVEQRGSVDR